MPAPVRTGPAGSAPANPRTPRRDRTEEVATTDPTASEQCPAEPARPRRRLRFVWKRLVWQRLVQRCTGAATASAPRRSHRTWLRRLGLDLLFIAVLVVVVAPPASAASSQPTLSDVIGNLTDWIVGILAGVATLFLTIGGLRYLAAGGDPGQVEKAKIALKSAAIGYALAILAPLIVSIVASIVS